MGHVNDVAGSFEQLNLNMQTQSVCVGGGAQLLLVSTSSLWFYAIFVPYAFGVGALS